MEVFKLSNYERLLNKKRELEQKRQLLLNQLEKENIEAAKSLLSSGKNVPLGNDLSRQIEVIDRALEILNPDLKVAEIEFIKEELEVNEKEFNKVSNEQQKAYQKLQKAEEVYRTATNEHNSFAYKCKADFEHLSSEKERLLNRLEELLPDSETI